ncbi:hypothetical protein [Brevibacterium sp. FME17]|uniref:hypothetical protein n=1 Tax=Brevibacterium sp. FME17 TaxID=2742606 RepID=UPI00186859C4|nr:hypothetical protein [Brevibacterium sp. FME17]
MPTLAWGQHRGTLCGDSFAPGYDVEGTVAGETDHDGGATGTEAVEDLRRFLTAGRRLVRRRS